MSARHRSSKRESSNELGRPETIGKTAVQVRPSRSIPKSLRVSPCPPARVRPLMQERHYLHSMPAVVCECFAVTLDDRLVGGVVFSAGARHAHRILQGAAPQHVVTLARLWLADELPANSESRVIGVVLRHLRRAGRHKLALSYADPAAGHRGTIYQASGWTYLGPTQTERYLEIDGRRVHARTAHSRYGTNDIAHLRRTGVVAVRRYSVPKHRYAFVLDPAWRWRLRAAPRPYPHEAARGPPPEAPHLNERWPVGVAAPTGQKRQINRKEIRHV